MKKIKLRILSLFTVLSILSCGKNEDCESTDLPVKSLESEYGCSDTRYGLQIDLSNDFYIIQSQQDFKNKISGNCNPKINFLAYDLIIGKKGLQSGNSSIEYNLISNCSKVLSLQVTFNQNVTLNAPNITYHALIPKLREIEAVEVEFFIKN